MELRHFRYFSAVAVFGSFSKAAGYLNLTQPALSRQIRDLEDELGVLLLNRNKKRIALTSAGESFYGDIVLILKQTEKAVRKLRSQRRSELLRIGYVHSLLGGCMPNAVAKFQAKTKDVEIELSDLSSFEVSKRAGEGLIDVAILPKSVANFFNGFEWTEILQVSPVIVASRKNRFAKRTAVAPAELDTEVLFGLGPTGFPEYEPRLRDILRPFGVVPKLHSHLAEDIPALFVQLDARRGAAVLTDGIRTMLPSTLVIRPFQPSLGPLVLAAGVPALNANPHADFFVTLLAEEASKFSRQYQTTRRKKTNSR